VRLTNAKKEKRREEDRGRKRGGGKRCKEFNVTESAPSPSFLSESQRKSLSSTTPLLPTPPRQMHLSCSLGISSFPSFSQSEAQKTLTEQSKAKAMGREEVPEGKQKESQNKSSSVFSFLPLSLRNCPLAINSCLLAGPF